jgi:hypothetical protein
MFVCEWLARLIDKISGVSRDVQSVRAASQASYQEKACIALAKYESQGRDVRAALSSTVHKYLAIAGRETPEIVGLQELGLACIGQGEQGELVDRRCAR